MTHYHTSSHVPGYLPDSDDTTAFDRIGDALAALASDLASYADSLYERLDAFRLPEDRTGDEDVETAEAVEEEGDRVHALALALEAYADRAREQDEDGRPAGSLYLDGERYPGDAIRTGGLAVHVTDPERIYDLGRTFELLPCVEACAEVRA